MTYHLQGATSLVEVLRRRAEEAPSQDCITYLLDGEQSEARFTYGDLDRQARTIAAAIQERVPATGERVLLLYPPGLDFIAAFMGSLFAHAVGVPVYPPDPGAFHRTLGKLWGIVRDSRPSLVLTTSELLPLVQAMLEQEPDLRELPCLATDTLPPELSTAWKHPGVSADTLAYLQYTSGSTSTPKGVMVTHGNLLHNLEAIRRRFGHGPDSRGVIWLPSYHDMGLIGGILQPLYVGFPVTLLSPLAFLENPFRWLSAVSRYRATTSGGPNFAYELCVRKITPEQRATLDLSSWRVAFNGAEPIRPATLEQFVAAFGPCGFRREAFFPCYGLAEATLIVSGGPSTSPPVVESFHEDSLEQHQVLPVAPGAPGARAWVGAGEPIDGHRVLVVNPESRLPCGPDQVGEVWVQGPCVANGYWNNPDATRELFGATLSGSGEGPFLRTGDLGMLRGQELFIAGRLKDLIIIRGRNHYPQDIELTVEKAHPSVRGGGCVAFSVEVEGEERLVVLAEVSRLEPGPESAAQATELLRAIRRAIAERHELQAHRVVLLPPRALPKTSSGKLQRRASRAELLAGRLKSLADSAELLAPQEQQPLPPGEEPQGPLELTVARAFAQVLGRAAVSRGDDFFSQGGDSLLAAQVTSRLRAELGAEVPLRTLFENPSVAALAAALERSRGTAPASPPALVRGAGGEEAPLSFAQQRLWFLSQLEPDNPAYHIPVAVLLSGRLEEAALEQAFRELVRRHELLRTSLHARNGTPFQRVAREVPFSITREDLRHLPEAEQEATARRLGQEEARRPFNLSQGPLFRVTLLRLAAERHLLLVTMHHLVSDGWSMGVLMRELAAHYEAASGGRPSPLPELPVQYTDFARWQQEWASSAGFADRLSWWKQQLTGLAPLQLPTLRPRPKSLSSRGARLPLTLPPELARALEALGQREGTTLYMTLLAGYLLLLQHYTGQEDIGVGSPLANRDRLETEPLIGFFVNTLVLRTQLTGNPSVRELLGRVREVALQAYANQDVPFEKIIAELHPERDPGRQPLLQAMFVLQNAPLPPLSLPALELRLLPSAPQATQFELTLELVKDEGTLKGFFEYSTDLFSEEEVARMSLHLQAILKWMVDGPARRLSELCVLSPEERQRILFDWNELSRPAVTEPNVHLQFEAQAARAPDALAVLQGQERLTYAELNRRANQFAHALHRRGVGPGRQVALCIERSVELITAILGVFKSGAAYVPLDPRYPLPRLLAILEDARPDLVLTDEKLAPQLRGHTRELLCLEAERAAWAKEPDTNPPPATQGEDLAYVVYTSGSTGRPKGVITPHRGITNYAAVARERLELGPTARMLQFASIGFDMATEEIFPALTSGAALVLRTDAMLDSVGTFLRQSGEQGVTHMILPTAYWHELVAWGTEADWASASALRVLLVGGEAMLAERVATWRGAPVSRRVRLINHYGPTEATIAMTMYDVPPAGPGPDEVGPSLPIGRPIAGTQVYVINRSGQPVPDGVAGELVIGGVGLTWGYQKLASVTAEKFIPCPFLGQGTRLYRTGDLVRRLPGGNIEFLGRIDLQVKIRGFRVEPQEIAAALSRHEGIREAFVMARQETGREPLLVAYLVAVPGAQPSSQELRGSLATQLPDYMIPSAFVWLEALPLNENGKVERTALPPPELGRAGSEQDYVPPSSPVEERVARIVADILRLERVSMQDSFFDLGGHSLLATQVVARVNEAFGVEIPLRQLFTQPTVAGIAQALEERLLEEIENMSEEEVRGRLG